MSAASGTPTLWRRIRGVIAGDGGSRYEQKLNRLADETRELKQSRAATKRKVERLNRDLGKYKERVQIMETQLSLLIQAAHGSVDMAENLREGTAQERYWAGHNGVRYVMHHLPRNWEIRIPIWREILSAAEGVQSVIELGCNIGDNLRAIEAITPGAKLAGIEVNAFAAEKARAEVANAEISTASLLRFEIDKRYDLAFTRGVLIHINPEELKRAYSQLAQLSNRYVLIYENYSPEPYTLEDYAKNQTIVGTEEGHSYQFWRDFAADFQAAEPGWKVVAEGPTEVEKKHGALVWALLEKDLMLA